MAPPDADPVPPPQAEGPPAPPGVREAEPEDHEAAAEALALAFADDPCWAHLLPDDHSRPERLLAFFNSEIEALVPRFRRVWVAEDGSAAAIWAPPGRWRVPAGVVMGEGRAMARVFGLRMPLALWTSLRFERHHPREREHWYLHYIGVEPRRQGMGLGGALMRPVLDECDAGGIAAHLEASTDRNRALYERHGFGLTGTFPMPVKGPPLRSMWREPVG